VRIVRTFYTALRALRRNVMRAVLTTLGIVIGVGAVIAMMEIGHGSSTAIQKTVAAMGANQLMIFPGTASSAGVSFGAGSSVTLTPEDCEAILRECPAVKNAAPIIRSRTQIVYAGKNWVPNYIFGTTPSYLDVRDWTTMAEGEAFTDRDVRNGSKVCLLGQTVVRELFGKESAIGKEIRVNNVSFKVIGVLVSKGASTFGSDQDDVLMAPWTTIKSRVSGSSMQGGNQSAAATVDTSQQVNTLSDLYPTDKVQLYPEKSAIQAADTPTPVRFTNIDQITAAAISSEQIQPAVQQMTELLRERHRIRGDEPEDFTIRDMTEMSNTLAATSNTMRTLLLAVAAISLVVGGVGIMNIMLVSVTERTREIGLRMAVGARARDILWQFLVEAVVLCLLGGALGILLGLLSSYLVTLTLKWPTESSPETIVAAVVVSATVGIVFGYYPAWKASRLDPIEALRYE
jgi:ABC-type antimicrobial peptide transport system permease subunit